MICVSNLHGNVCCRTLEWPACVHVYMRACVHVMYACVHVCASTHAFTHETMHVDLTYKGFPLRVLCTQQDS